MTTRYTVSAIVPDHYFERTEDGAEYTNAYLDSKRKELFTQVMTKLEDGKPMIIETGHRIEIVRLGVKYTYFVDLTNLVDFVIEGPFTKKIEEEVHD